MFGTEWLETSGDERVLVHTHPSRWIIFQQFLAALFISLNLSWLLFQDFTAGLEIGDFSVRLLIALLIPLSFFPVVVAQIRRISVHFVVTDNNVWAKKRIFAREVDPTVLSRVQDVNYSQGFIDRLLGKGEVRIETAGTGGTDVVMHEVPNPRRITNLIREKIEEHDRQPSAQVI